MSLKSKNWNDACLEHVSILQEFKRKDGGITMKYHLLCPDTFKQSWMSERFGVDEAVVDRRIKPLSVLITEANSRHQDICAGLKCLGTSFDCCKRLKSCASDALISAVDDGKVRINCPSEQHLPFFEEVRS